MLIAATAIATLLSARTWEVLPSAKYTASVAPGDAGREKQLGRFFGFNTNMLHHEKWTNETAAIACSLPVVRYPGGTVGDYWSWQDGWVIADDDYFARFPTSTAYKFSHNRKTFTGQPLYTLDNLKLLLDVCAARGQPKTVNFMLNLLTRELPDQLALLHRASALGIPVEIIELGNELYYGCTPHKPWKPGCDFTLRFPSAAAYGANASVWAAAIKRAWPAASVSVAALEHRSTDENNPRMASWTAGMMRWIDKKAVDSITYHPYWDAGVFLSEPPKDPSAWIGSLAQQTEEQRDLEDSPTNASLAISSAIGAMLWDVANYTKGTGTLLGLDVRVTEMNVFDRVGSLRYSWVHGLQVAGASIVLAGFAPVAQVLHHSFDGCCGFALHFVAADGLAPSYFAGRLVPPLADDATSSLEHGSPSAAGHVLEALHALFLSKDGWAAPAARSSSTVWPLQFDPPPPDIRSFTSKARPSNWGAVPGVVGMVAGGGGDATARLALANLLPDACAIDAADAVARALGRPPRAGDVLRWRLLRPPDGVSVAMPILNSSSLNMTEGAMPVTAGRAILLHAEPFSLMTAWTDIA
jgi:hypothetical protein